MPPAATLEEVTGVGTAGLVVTIGQATRAGTGKANQDFHGAVVPGEPALGLKGVAVAIADGIGSSRVSDVASSVAVRSVLEDYYCTPEGWTVKSSASRVIAAANAWLHAETRRTIGRRAMGGLERDRGYVCTLSALILRGRTGHVFHVGDGRVARRSGRTLEALTEDHRVSESSEQTYLARALGAAPHVEIDYRTVALERGDVFVLTTDGVHDHVGAGAMAAAIGADLGESARQIVALAQAAGSTDDLTVQLVRVEAVPPPGVAGMLEQAGTLAPAPLLEPGTVLDGFRVVRTLHDSARSHLYLAVGPGGGQAVLKVPSIALRHEPAYLRRFMIEDWVARQVSSAHVLKPWSPEGPLSGARTALYLAFAFVDGQTLAQWMRDHPDPAVETVRGIVEQVAAGLSAFHRREMIHADLRPENVMISADGVAVIVDFGATHVAGVAELLADAEAGPLGTAQYSAPEVLLGQPPSVASDQFSLGVIAYQMLTGRLPYGAAPAQVRSARQLRGLRYRSARERRPALPDWVDGALRRAVHPSPAQRYQAVSEFVFDLRHPNADLAARRTPLAERDPVLFWKAVALLLAVALAAALVLR